MKKIIVLIAVLFSGQFCLAQPTQAEIDKMMKQAQDMIKKYGNDTTVNKITKGLQNQQKQVNDAMKNQNNTATNGSLYADPGDYGNVDNWKFPVKNVAILSSLPKKILTRVELIYFLNEVYTRLAKN